MENQKKCSECLHFKVCIEYQVVDRSMDLVKGNDKENLKKIANSIAVTCAHYLVYDERSTEIFMQNAKSAMRSFEWIIAMCTPNGEVGKKNINTQSDEWFKNTFVHILKKGLEDLKSITTEENQKES